MLINQLLNASPRTILRIFKTKYITKHTHICGKTYVYRNIRISQSNAYTTHRDQHRQKAVFETTTPKIVLENKPKIDNTAQNEVSFRDKIYPYIQLMRLDKPTGIFLLYWPCTWSISLGAIATGLPVTETARLLALFGAGSVLMRGAGCTINDMWDKDIDSKVARTQSRPLVTGAITQKQALSFLALQLSASLAILLQLNWYSVVLGASSLALVVTYPLAKRYSSVPQLVLGATFNWGALLGYSAAAGEAAGVCLPLYLGACCWTMVYDTIYAHQDKKDDLAIKVHSSALTFGEYNIPILLGCALTSISMLYTVGHIMELGVPYNVALVLAGTHAGRQILTLKMDDPADCASKFKSNTWIGLLIFLGIIGGGYDQYMRNLEKRRQKEQAVIVP